MKKNIVVLGATGTVGSKIAEILLNEGHHVTLVARQAAAGHLANLDFMEKSVQAVMGPRDYTYAELTSIVGNAIDKPDLAYVQLPAEKVREVFLGNGFSPDFVSNLIEMGTAISNGYMNYQKRDESTTSATTAEQFASEVYAPAFQR